MSGYEFLGYRAGSLPITERAAGADPFAALLSRTFPRGRAASLPGPLTMLVEHKAELRRLVLFSLVGGLNTAVCFALFAALIDLCAWHHHLALVADYTFGIALGYVLHRVSTFADRKHVRQALGKYMAIALVTFLVNFALLDVLVRLELLDPLAAQAVALALVTLASYLAAKALGIPLARATGNWPYHDRRSDQARGSTGDLGSAVAGQSTGAGHSANTPCGRLTRQAG